MGSGATTTGGATGKCLRRTDPSLRRKTPLSHWETLKMLAEDMVKSWYKPNTSRIRLKQSQKSQKAVAVSEYPD
jgi:hypothetical protein